MDQERINQLRKETENRTELENSLVHVIQSHLGLVGVELQTASAELQLLTMDVEDSDERAQKLIDFIDQFLRGLNIVMNDVLNTLPGVMTEEEAKEVLSKTLQEKMAIEQFKRMAEENSNGKLHD